ncbi:PAS domain-containing protein [Streptomyces chiangmaiensis]
MNRDISIARRIVRERQMDTSHELLRSAAPSALLTLDGAIHHLNAAMARTLGRSAEQCVGRTIGELLPASQRMAAESLAAHAATTRTITMRALKFPAQADHPWCA